MRRRGLFGDGGLEIVSVDPVLESVDFTGRLLAVLEYERSLHNIRDVDGCVRVNKLDNVRCVRRLSEELGDGVGRRVRGGAVPRVCVGDVERHLDLA